MDIKFSNGKLSIVGNQDLEEIPASLGEYGKNTKELAIRECKLSKVSNLNKFTELTSLVLDNNRIGDENEFHTIETLENLWLNNNNICYLDRFLNGIEGKYPRLKYLSLLKNPCCPNYFVGKGSNDYNKYRATVIGSIPTLKFLDASPVTVQERLAAEKQKQRTYKLDSKEYQKKGTGYAVGEEKGLPEKEYDNNMDKAILGRTKYVYYGKHSEGNRFIIDTNL